MKALTFWQPWASLVVAFAKPFEFRGWRPPAAIVGQRIVIHAGRRRIVADEVRAIMAALVVGGADEAATCLIKDRAMPVLGAALRGELPLAAGLGTGIVGEARHGHDIAVADFGFPDADAEQLPGLPGLDSDRREHANWGWPMLAVEAWPEPIPCRGAMGLWTWPTPADVLL